MASIDRSINLHCRFTEKTYKEFLKFIEETGLTKTKAVEKALVHYMEYYKKTGKIN